MDRDEFKKRILEESDYIKCPKCSNSIEKFLAKNIKEPDNRTIARLLMMTEEEVEKYYQEAIKMLQEGMKND